MRLAATFVSLALLSLAPTLRGATKVTFDDQGFCRVDGKRFFPIGVWVYGIDSNVLADLHEHHFNTVLGNGLNPRDVPAVEQHGLMMIPMASDEFLKAAKNSPSLLAWYLNDEPEEHDTAPELVKKDYQGFKAKD